MKHKRAEYTWGQIAAAIVTLFIVVLLIVYGGKVYAWASKQRGTVSNYIVPPECRHDTNPGQNIPYGTDGIYDGVVIDKNGKETDCRQFKDANNANLPA
jgi:hypothetical protein